MFNLRLPPSPFLFLSERKTNKAHFPPAQFREPHNPPFSGRIFSFVSSKLAEEQLWERDTVNPAGGPLSKRDRELPFIRGGSWRGRAERRHGCLFWAGLLHLNKILSSVHIIVNEGWSRRPARQFLKHEKRKKAVVILHSSFFFKKKKKKNSSVEFIWSLASYNQFLLCVFFFFKQCLKATELIGAFVSPAVSLKLILSDLQRAPMASYLMILAALIRGSPRKVLQPHLVSLGNALCNPEVSQRTEEVRREAPLNPLTKHASFQSVDVFSPKFNTFGFRRMYNPRASCKIQSGSVPGMRGLLFRAFGLRLEPQSTYSSREKFPEDGSNINLKAQKSKFMVLVTDSDSILHH